MVFIRISKGWEIPSKMATPEAVYMNRRQFMKGVGAIAGGTALSGLATSENGFGGIGIAHAVEQAGHAEKMADLYPLQRNSTFQLDRPITEEEDAITYNNFYEFGSHKSISQAAQLMQTSPWKVIIDGDVEKTIEIDAEDLIRKLPLEERLYRHRCVETWAMAVPWSGFTLKSLVDFAAPTSNAKFLKMETAEQTEVMPGLSQFWYPWPYVEGLTIEEANNPLSFIATGIYGKPIVKQCGAPLRLVVPWKYGFKAIKSIVKFTFTNERPVSFWEDIQASEYGFWANVNPDVPHKRWSQRTERMLGTNETFDTQKYNGYGEHVAHLYSDIENDPVTFR